MLNDEEVVKSKEDMIYDIGALASVYVKSEEYKSEVRWPDLSAEDVRTRANAMIFDQFIHQKNVESEWE
jgi:hypothetical protein